MTRRPLINPLAIVAGKTKLQPNEQEDFELPFWLALDQILDGRSNDGAIGIVTKYGVMLQIIAADIQNRQLYDFTCSFIKHWQAAVELGHAKQSVLQLSTQTRKLLLAMAERWERVISQVTLGLLSGAATRWQTLAHYFEIPESV